MRTLSIVAAALLAGCGSSSSGGTGDAGYLGSGGASGGTGGGSPGTGGSTPAACTTGTVTFSLTAPAGRESSYCVGSECVLAWVEVRTAAGVDVPITWPCITTCSECAPVACKMSCLAPQPLAAAGVEKTWDGTSYAQSTCGAAVTCVNQSCAPAGQYVAKMCAYPRTNPDAATGCESGSTPTCVEIPFTYPTATVAGTLP